MKAYFASKIAEYNLLLNWAEGRLRTLRTAGTSHTILIDHLQDKLKSLTTKVNVSLVFLTQKTESPDRAYAVLATELDYWCAIIKNYFVPALSDENPEDAILGRLLFYGNYTQEDVGKQKDTGYIDKCMFCGKLENVENLIYGPNSHDSWQVICQDCYELKDMEHKDLWSELNSKGSWNNILEEYQPWGFVWGKPNVDNLKKAVATVIKKDADKWLTSRSEAFPETPWKLVLEDNFEPIYLAIWQAGVVIILKE